VEVSSLEERAEAAEEPQLERKVEAKAVRPEDWCQQPPELQLVKHGRPGEPERRSRQHKGANDADAQEEADVDSADLSQWRRAGRRPVEP
jgi:hypothetical protein